MILWKLIVGILLIIAPVVTTLLCIKRTPEHLRGWYGAMYWTIALFGLIGGIVLTMTAFV